jgi:adenylate kinase
MEPKTYVFFGNVGAGKGTQIDLMKKVCAEKNQHFVYFYPGAEFRALIASGGYTSERVKSILEKGGLLPDAMTSGMFTSLLTKELAPESVLFVDGYPRSIQQSNDFIQTMEFYGRTNIEMIYIDVSKEEAVKRMKLRGRIDDTDEGIAIRFEVYENNVLPALEILKQKGYTLHRVNGLQAVDLVHSEVKAALGI